MSNDLAISARGLSKRYRIGGPREKYYSLRDSIMTSIRSIGRLGRGGPREQDFWALRDVSLQIRRGENVGIIGLNGAGKSTLLKILSRIVTPTEGEADVVGRTGALLEVGTGFHPELTGRENVYLYGAILGMTRDEINRKFDAIVDFSEIGEYIDTPIKRYSSGMYVRLAFSVAAHLEPEILLVDEVLSVGDLAFQAKCMEFAKGLQRKDATILFVSHNMHSIKTMCERVIYLKSGVIEFDGSVEEGIERYDRDCRLSPDSWVSNDTEEWPLIVTQCDLLGEDGEPQKVFKMGERLRVRIQFSAREEVIDPNFMVLITRSDGVQCCNYSLEADGGSLGAVSGEGSIEVVTPPMNLVADMYVVRILVRAPHWQELLCAQIGGTFHVKHDLFDRHFGVFHEQASWMTEAG